MKFDYIISNPPYNNGLDLKILKAIYPLGEKICFIHPGGWLLSNKENKRYMSLKNMFRNDLKYYYSYLAYLANSLFGIGLFIPLFITYFLKDTLYPVDMEKIDIHGDSAVCKSLYEKSMLYSKRSNLLMNMVRSNEKTWLVGIGSIRGHAGTSDFYTMIERSDPRKSIGLSTKYRMKYGFGTSNEAENFLMYINLKITRFLLAYIKINQNLDRGELKAVPYMPTYTHEWTDEMVAKELGLTDEELRWAINWIPDYYPEDAEKYAKYHDPEQTERQRITKGTFGGYTVNA